MPATTTPTTASQAAEEFSAGFLLHDDQEYDAAAESFAVVDKFQFRHLDDDAAEAAARAYADALRRKDELEDSDCALNIEGNWGGVTESLEERADIVGADPRYADHTSRAWRLHNVGGEYWTPIMRAQLYESRAILQDDSYPDKTGNGSAGFGVLPSLYLAGVELHDARQFDHGLDVMVAYFRIMEALR